MIDPDEIVAGRVGEIVDTYLTRITPFGFSGSALVAKKGSIVLNKGYGLADRSSAIPNTAGKVQP